jgi:hypothetical protein
MEDNIKIDCEDMNWIQLPHGFIQWLEILNTDMNLWVP